MLASPVHAFRDCENPYPWGNLVVSLAMACTLIFYQPLLFFGVLGVPSVLSI